MSLTLSVIRAALGASAGHQGAHPALLESARNHLALAVQQGALTDAHAYGAGEGIALLLAHEQGEGAEAVHRLAWDTLAAAAEVARGLHLSGAGRDLLTDEFPGSLRAAGPAFAELTLDERPAETVVVLLSTQTATGAYNLPLYRAFADPFNTPGLVLAEALHEGFTFEIHDTMLGRKIVFTTPQETYDLLGFIGVPSRFVVKRIASRATGEVACVASSERMADLGGGSMDDGPVAIVRTHGVFPTTGELTEPFATPALVAGGMRGTHVGPWMPVALDGGAPGRWDGPPRVVALGFHVADGGLAGPRDLFADVAFDAARRAASDLAEVMRRLGPFEPHRLPLDEVEFTTAMPAAAARLTSRWSPI